MKSEKLIKIFYDFSHADTASIGGVWLWFARGSDMVGQRGNLVCAAWPHRHSDHRYTALTQGKVAKEMETLTKEHGIASFKMFMAYKGVFMLEDDELYEAFKVCKRLGALSQVQALLLCFEKIHNKIRNH